ncbi:hypothetical protein [Hymenobacter cellulosilyticus]|uniref:Uncharacterized protein n=1 Tax=Hymenobacter cellulosilyticus TaxID=2932248 RepID=A0A8T9Q8E9_9BACT|nr:hypothetical protein [Hymenobacter cellulosilyticus]UOQ73232.1 hypothetical protein MUN79_04475 [Hymenobacter cellulosilyticus]
MKTTFESESDALATPASTPTTAQPTAATAPAATEETPVPVAGNGSPDYSQVQVKTQPDLPREVEPGGSATEAESGGGYSG